MKKNSKEYETTYEEEKSEKVRRSVNIAFNKDVKEDLSSNRESEAQSMKEGHTFDRIEGLFEAQITSFDSEKSKILGRMNVQVEYERFVNAITKPDQIDILRYPSRRAIRDNFFLPTLVSIMKANIDGAPTRIEIIFHTKDNPADLQNDAPQELKAKINDIGLISRTLEAQGLPQKLLNIGLEQGDPDIVDLNFIKYIPFSPVTSNPSEEADG